MIEVKIAFVRDQVSVAIRRNTVLDIVEVRNLVMIAIPVDVDTQKENILPSGKSSCIGDIGPGII